MATHTPGKVNPPLLTIAPGAWCDEAAWWVSQAVRALYLPAIRAQVENELASLFFVAVDGVTCGCFVVRIDRFATHDEGVIMAAAGELPGIDLIATCLPDIEAKFKGCTAVRYHTERPAVARKMARWGYVADEIICRKELSHGIVQ